MRIVVTGALGYIGSRLVPALGASFADVDLVLIDNLSAQPSCPLSALGTDRANRFYEADVLTADLDELFDGADAVVHLAAIADAAGSFDYPGTIERINHAGTLRVAQACIRAGASLAFPSTTSVYGTSSGHVAEDCDPAELHPQSPYASIKLESERKLAAFQNDSGLRHSVFRFGTVFGPSPGMKFMTAVNKFCRQAVEGDPITVWRTAMDQQRPYLEIGDAVAALTFALRHDLFNGDVFNVVTVNTTVRSVLSDISAFIPDFVVQCVESPAMNAFSFSVDSGRFGRAGFLSGGKLRDGIEATIRSLQTRAAAVTLATPALPA